MFVCIFFIKYCIWGVVRDMGNKIGDDFLMTSLMMQFCLIFQYTLSLPIKISISYKNPQMIRNDYDYLFKFILIGNTNVGKSCVLMRLLQGRFKSMHEPTLGVEFGSKMFNINQKDIKIQIWDTAGQQSFKSITRAYYKGSIAAILVFDITNQRSFEDISNWLYQIRNHSHQKIHLMLLGNKKDLQSQREVSYESAANFAKQNGFQNYIETSALNGENVDKPFNQLACRILKQIETGVINVENDTTNGVKPGKKFRPKYPSAHVELLKQAKKTQTQQQCKC